MQREAHRIATKAGVRKYLDAKKPNGAIRALTLALVEDPEFEDYHHLLTEAAKQQHAQQLKPGEADPWETMPTELLAKAVELKAFAAYLKELEALLNEASATTKEST